MNPSQPRTISVFIASPGDLASERKAFKDTIDSLNQGFGDGANVEFIPIGWEDENSEAGRRVQDVLNRRIRESDLFVLALHRRWGQKAPDSAYSSYTEEEFHVAMDLWKQRQSPEVIIFFKNVDSASIADPGPQLAQVLEFKKQLEASHDIIFRSFASESDFGKEVDRHLRDFARGAWKTLDNNAPVTFPGTITGPLEKATHASEERVQQVESEKRQLETTVTKTAEDLKIASGDLTLVKAFQKEFALARAAVDAAQNNRIEDAKILFAQATEGTTDLSILSAAAEFYRQVNDIDNASRMVQRQASIARDRTIATEHYMKLVPSGFLSEMQEQVLAQLLQQYPPEVQEEIHSVYTEVYGNGKIEQIMAEMMVHYYTVEEIVQLAAFLASPVGQSSLQKQREMTLAMMQYGQQEFERVLRARHPDWFDDAGEAPEADDAAQLAAAPPAAQLAAEAGAVPDATAVPSPAKVSVAS
jgi:hypothetical protein